jgi:hypothetical protein
MGEAGVLGDPVSAAIARLESAFGSFPINQRTLTVPQDAYEAVRTGDPGEIEVFVRVSHDDQGVLSLPGAGPALPHDVVEPGTPLQAAVTAQVRRAADIECTPTGVARATITGLNTAAHDGPTVHRLVALVEADHDGGEPEAARWTAEQPSLPPYL